MAVSSVGSGTTSTAVQNDTTKLGADFDQFLNLLTTQLQNQDPLDPMDSAQFTQQLVAFSGVEQQIKANGLLSSLLSAQTLSMTSLGVSFIGKNVEVAGNKFQQNAGASANISYELPSAAEVGTVTITNADGVVVYSEDAEVSAGLHNFTWDGKDKDGLVVPAGKYTVKVVATDEAKNSLNVSTYVPGFVSSLETANDGSLVLDIYGEKVPLSDVRKISLAS